MRQKDMSTHILVTCVCKHYDREDGKSSYGAGPCDNVDFAAVCHGVSLEEMSENQNYEIGDRNQGYHAGIFERIETTKERQRNDNQPVDLLANLPTPEASPYMNKARARRT